MQTLVRILFLLSEIGLLAYLGNMAAQAHP